MDTSEPTYRVQTLWVDCSVCYLEITSLAGEKSIVWIASRTHILILTNLVQHFEFDTKMIFFTKTTFIFQFEVFMSIVLALHNQVPWVLSFSNVLSSSMIHSLRPDLEIWVIYLYFYKKMWRKKGLLCESQQQQPFSEAFGRGVNWPQRRNEKVLKTGGTRPSYPVGW